MPTQKPRVTFTLSEEQLSQINEYRYGKHLKNQSQAILSLVEKGLSQIERESALSEPVEPTEKNAQLKSIIELYNGFNTIGRNKLADYAMDLKIAGVYDKRSNVPIAVNEKSPRLTNRPGRGLDGKYVV